MDIKNTTYRRSILNTVDRKSVMATLIGGVQSPSVPVQCPPSLKQYSLIEVADHCDVKSCWIAIHDKVYNVTEFLNMHPGGLEILLEHAGSDATIAFEDKGHSEIAYRTLEQYCIGELVEGDRRKKTVTS